MATEKHSLDSSERAQSKTVGPNDVAGPSPPPNGGIEAWTQCLAAFLLFMNSWGIVNAFGSFEEYYQSTLLESESSSTIAWIGTLQAFLFISGSIVTGPLFDQGYLRPLMFAGAFFVVFGLMMLSLCHNYLEVILAQGLTIGIGNACLFVPSSAIIPQYFSSRKALAMGISIAVGAPDSTLIRKLLTSHSRNQGGNVGGIIYSATFTQLVPSLGFGWTVRVMGFLALALFLPGLVIMRQRLRPSQVRSMIDSSALREPSFISFTATCFVAYVGFYIMWFFANSFGKETGVVSTSLSSYMVTFLNTGSFFGRLVLCGLADKVGALNMFIFCSIAMTTLCFGWIGVFNGPGAICLFLLYGGFSGAFISLLLSTVATTFCPDLSKLGTRTGMVCLVCSIGFLIGSPIGGKLLDYGWIGPQAFSGAVLALSIILGFVTKTLILRVSHVSTQ